MHKIHECRWSIRQSNRHHCELKMLISRSKRSLMDICLPNSQLMVAGMEIYLRGDPRPSQLIKQIINSWQRVPILNSSPIQLPIIYTQPKSLVPLLGNRTGEPQGEVLGLMKPLSNNSCNWTLSSCNSAGAILCGVRTKRCTKV